MAPRYLTPGEVAEILQVSRDTLRRWRKEDDRGPAFIQEGRLIRYPPAGVNAWLRRCHHPAGTRDGS